MRALAAAFTALLAPTAAVQPPIYAAATSGAWHGVVSTSGVRVKGAGTSSTPVEFAPDRAAWVVALDDRHTLVVHTVGVVPAAGGVERIVKQVTPEKSSWFLGIGWPS